MTGFGRVERIKEQGIITVELRAINHRFLEVVLRHPKELTVYEDEIKRIIQEHVKRGRVECTITIEHPKDQRRSFEVDWVKVEDYIRAAKEIEERFSIPYSINMQSILSLPELFVPIQEEGVVRDKDDILETVESATHALLEMRIKEGAVLKGDFSKRVKYVLQQINHIEIQSQEVVQKYRTKLKARVQEFLSGSTALDEARIMNEVAIYADKSNIDEELIRLESHCKQFLQLLESEDPIGRKLDFLLQEMNREANTIGSKGNDLLISQTVINIKSEIEKLREQVQNIE